MCVVKRKLPPQSYLQECFFYDEATGLLKWLERPDAHFKKKSTAASWNSRNAGKPAFLTTSNGYRGGRLNGQVWSAHRVIWKLVHGDEPKVIDHINRDKSDNRLANLRNGTQRENARNTPYFLGLEGPRPHALWGKRKGISRRKNRWIVRLFGLPGCKEKHIGSFPCWGKALKAKIAAERRRHD